MDLFTRASILSHIDGHIAQRRKSPVLKKTTTEVPSLSSVGRDVFSELIRHDIDSALVGGLKDYFERFDFKFTSSVGKKIEWYAVIEENGYDILRDVNLYDHTIRVARNALEDKNTEENQRGLVGLFALLHDAGKSEELCRYFGIAYGMGHEKAGAEFIEIFLHGTDYEALGRKFSGDLIKLHHAKNKNKGYQELTFYGEALHRADSLARKQEIEILGENDGQ